MVPVPHLWYEHNSGFLLYMLHHAECHANQLRDQDSYVYSSLACSIFRALSTFYKDSVLDAPVYLPHSVVWHNHKIFFVLDNSQMKKASLG